MDPHPGHKQPSEGFTQHHVSLYCFCPTEVNVHWNKAVTLQCVKPSNLASLTWKSPQIHETQDKLFIHSADGNLSFFATNATFGTYRCEAEEDGYVEVVASYDVREFSPRSVRPRVNVDEHDVSINEEPYEDIGTVEPTVSVETSGTGDSFTEPGGDETVTTNLKDGTIVKAQDSGPSTVQVTNPDQIPASKEYPQSRNELLGESLKEKSYYSELVVVSLLLVISICVLILGGLHMWRQSKTASKVNSQVSPANGKKSKSMESVPSLSPEDADPEVKVVQGWGFNPRSRFGLLQLPVGDFLSSTTSSL